MDAKKYIEGRIADRSQGDAGPVSHLVFYRRTLLCVLVLVPLLVFGRVAHQSWKLRQNYPFGFTHCCDKILSLTLLNYAEANGGWFPKGESCPEASLSLLYRANPSNLCYLPGKSVPEDTVKAILENGGLLGPTTCGWHYVEGLRNDDDSRLGLFWDKEGLNHNGGRLPEGGHYVCRVNGIVDYVRGKDWPAFLVEQAKLHKQLKREPEKHEPETKSEVVE